MRHFNNWHIDMKKRDKTLAGVVIAHGAVIMTIAMCGVSFHSAPKEVRASQAIQHIQSLPAQSMTSIATSEEVNQTIEKFREMRSTENRKEEERRQQIDDLKREATQRAKSAATKRSELSKISRQIEAEKVKLDELRKKKLADLKRKQRLAVEKRAKDVAIATEKKKENEKIAIKKMKAEIAAQKSAKEAEIKRIANVKEIARQAELVKAKNIKSRGEYEGQIYSQLFGSWALPYVRDNVKCSVQLNVAKDGSITGYKFTTACPDLQDMLTANPVTDADIVNLSGLLSGNPDGAIVTKLHPNAKLKTVLSSEPVVTSQDVADAIVDENDIATALSSAQVALKPASDGLLFASNIPTQSKIKFGDTLLLTTNGSAMFFKDGERVYKNPFISDRFATFCMLRFTKATSGRRITPDNTFVISNVAYKAFDKQMGLSEDRHIQLLKMDIDNKDFKQVICYSGTMSSPITTGDVRTIIGNGFKIGLEQYRDI